MRYFMLLLSFMLLGCGGSSGSDVPPPVQTNTAPVLSGQLSLTLSVASTGALSFALQDAENDALSVSFTGKPDWVSSSQNGNQLQLSATAGFFDVGQHQFDIRVSDGKLHSDYTIYLTVSDDPSKWTEIATPKEEFIGQWALDNGDALHLYANETGRYLAADGDVFDLVWFGMNGFIEISSTQVNCVVDECFDYFEVYVIASEEGRKRIVLESDENALAVTVTPYTAKPIEDGLFSLNHLAVDYVHTIKGSDIKIYTPFKFAVSGSSLSSWASVETQLGPDGGLRANSKIHQFSMRLYRYTIGDYVDVGFDVNVIGGKILPSAESRLTIEYQLSFTLADNTVNPEDFDGLTDALAQSHVGHLELGVSAQLPVPQFELNKSYFSSFRLIPDFDNHNMLFGGTEVIFTSASKGVARFSIPQRFSIQESEFDWSVEDNQLVLILGEQEYRYRFIQHPVNGLSLVNDYNLYYPLLVAQQLNATQPLMGSYLLEQYANRTPTYHNFFADNTASLFTDYKDNDISGYKSYKWQQENDGSITALYTGLCENEQTFSECADAMEQRLANGESVVVNYRNFKVIKETEQEMFIQYNYDYRTQSINQSFQNVSRLLKIAM
ncbi:hypothetical protein ABGI61_04740 [Rheinheimera sp. FR7-31]|uniref:hypothetical protein n=1 Tax=Rheinheimera fenheensis TaxID=3152295 RepID=UPI00325D244E